MKDGNKSQAVECFQKCVDVSPEMALALIKECRREGVECIVAPYEADAQLAYLQKENIVDLVITEDSDMLVFGCKRVCACYNINVVTIFYTPVVFSRCCIRWMILEMESSWLWMTWERLIAA